MTAAVLHDEESAEIQTFSRWFIRLRWLAFLFLLLMLGWAFATPGVLPSDVRLPLLALLACLPLANLTLVWFHRRAPVSERFLFGQIVVDLFIVALMWHWTGGVESPLSLLVVLHVIMAGAALEPRHCYLAAGWIGTLLLAAAALELAGALPHHHLGVAGDCRTPLPGFVFPWMLFHVAQLSGAAYITARISRRSRGIRSRLQDAADAAKAQQQLLERALDTTGSGLRLVNEDLQTIWASSLWQEWFQGDARAARADAVRQVFKTGRFKVREASLSEQDPERPGKPKKRIFRVTAAPITGASGKVRQAAELAQDVTSEKRAQAEMLRTGKLVAVGELAAVVAHEINNPLGILNAKAQLLMQSHRDNMSPKAANEIQKIYELSERVAAIAQGLLSACRPARGARKKLDLRSPVHRVLAMMEAEKARKGVKLVDELEEPLWVLANGSELEQVILNLTLNALHAMPEGGTLTISSRQAQDNDKLLLTIEDSGEGIPPEHLERVWEPFFSTKGDAHGTGLGLSVCMTIIQSHGGTIDIESEVGRGTCIRIQLPRHAGGEQGADGDTPHPSSG